MTSTHWDGCHTEHHECALALIDFYASYPRRPLPTFETPAEELDYWRIEAVNLDTWYAVASDERKALSETIKRLTFALERIAHDDRNPRYAAVGLDAVRTAQRALEKEST